MRLKILKTTGSSADRGSVTLESAFGLPAFFLIVFLGIETLRLSFVALSLQYGVVNTARWAALNLSDPSSTRIESIENKVRRFSTLDVNGDQISICPVASPGTCNAVSDIDAGPGNWMKIQATYPIAFFFGAMTYTLNASALVKNEPTA